MKNLLLLSIFLCSNLIFAQTSTPPAVGDGSFGSPYEIATINNLYWLSQNPTEFDKYFLQTADIDAIGDSLWDGGQGFTPIGNSYDHFTGDYNGQGYTISHVYINRPSTDYVGLFSYASNPSNISNLGATNVNITGHYFTGGFIGFNNYMVSNCYSTGSVLGYEYSGGFIGTSDGTVNTSYSTCNIDGNSDTYGGFMGYNAGTVLNCYSRGNNGSSADNAAGFISWNTGTIIFSYSTGIVSVNSTNGFGGTADYGTYFANFFDQTTSLQSSGYGASAKTTPEMKSYATFTSAGWDVNIWNLDPGVNNGYPYLKWQNPSGTSLPVELSSFTAKVSDYRTVILNWETKTEKNSNKFNVERKNSTHDWQIVGSVKASVLSSSSKNYSFTDTKLQSGIYQFRLKMIDNDGSFTYSQTIETDVSSPDVFTLSQNYPNPFNPSTKINYSLPFDSRVTLEVFNVAGVKISQLVNEVQSAGYYSVDFNPSSIGRNISTGVYFYRISAFDNINKTNFSSVKKMILIK